LRPSLQTPRLTRVQHLGFRALAQGSEGPKKLQILKPWPNDRIPPACASLLSIASEPGLLAAAGPESLIVTSTEKVRKTFSGKAGEWDVITDFSPDVTIPLGASPLRQVVFSNGGEFLVISAEEKGALAVFDVTKLMQGHRAPERQIQTEGVAVRTLQSNPGANQGHYMAVVLDTGKLWVVDVAEDKINPLKEEGVCCATWSSKGKAVAAGLEDGTTQIYMTDGTLKATIPRPPEVDENYQVTGLAWLQNSELFVVHSPKASATVDDRDNKYHLIECNKAWSAFDFHATAWDVLSNSNDCPPRAFPPRISATRLQNWKPDLDDMLIITSSHAEAVQILTSSSKPWSEEQADFDYKKWVLTAPEDTRMAAVPRLVFGEDGDSLVVGEALDLSATEKILRPIPALEEINEAPHPLPAYMLLTNQGVIMAWWVVWNRSVEQGTCYPGLVAGNERSTSTPQAAKQTALPTPAKPQQTSTFGQPSTPAAASSSPGFGSSAFAKAASTFGNPAVSVPHFGATGLGSTPPFIPKTTQPFGSASTTPATGKPAPLAFGSPSMIGAPKTSGFGAVGGMGNKASPWATSSQDASTPQTQANPFSAAAGSTTGFAKFGQAGGNSSFSSFGSNNAAQSGFGSLGQQQKSGFPGLKTEPSGSTITLGSGTGSSLPSWAGTPAQGGSGFSGFAGLGQSKSSFNTSSFESKTSELSGGDRKRDEATPTPQPGQGLFGGGFTLGSTFKSDGTAKDDLPKPAAPSTASLFGSDFTSGLGGNNSKPPATPAKEANNDTAQDVSTTPASPPRQQKSLFSGPTPAKESATPRAPPPVDTGSKSNDAPLPPDFLTSKPPQSADDDLPPLAGSPGVKVEAPSSSVEASPIDDEDGDEESGFSEEEDDEGTGDETEEVGEPSPSDASRRPQSKNRDWSFQNSLAQSTRDFPPAPTPPAVRSGATSTSGRSASPAQPALFGQSSKPAQATSLFGQQPQKGPLSFGNKGAQSSTPAKPLFPPPTNRPQASLRSPSPTRSASASALRTRRDPIAAPGSSLSASIQSKPPTPQPEVADLEDEEDERMREQLAQAIEPSRTLEDFVAFQNYTGKSQSKTGHAAQIEMMYKDINGMIDALGWNARSVKSFIEYHKRPQPSHKVDRRALEDAENDGEDGSWFEQWTLCEIENLKSLEDELERELDAGRVQDVFDKLGQLARLLNDKAKLTTRLNEIRRQIVNRRDPDKVEASRKAPLSKEMVDKQKELRNDYARLLKLLNQAEEGSVFLKSRLASYCAQNGKGNNVPVPTVDAVKRTIVKMIALAETRNNDITLIESQLRKLAITDSNRPSSPSSRTLGTPRKSRGTSLRSSMVESPYATPPTSRSKMSLSELNRRALTPDVDATPTASKGYGLTYTSEGGATPGNELARMSDMVDENIETLRATARRRKQVAAGLKRALIERGIKTTKVN
jgi:nucleoporin NUP159